MSKKKKIIIFVVVLILIIGLYKFINNKEYEKTTNDIKYWKTYTNQEYGFEFKYPPMWGKREHTLEAISLNGISVKIDSSKIKDRKIINLSVSSVRPSLIGYNDGLSLFENFDFEEYKEKATINNLSIGNIPTYKRFDKTFDPTEGCIDFPHCTIPSVIELLLYHNGYYYRFAFAGNDIKKDNNELSIDNTISEKIIKTFRFID